MSNTENQETVEASGPSARASESEPAVPGLVHVFSQGKAFLTVLPLAREGTAGGRALELGRGLVGSVTLDDFHLSRRHVRVGHNLRGLGGDEGWSVRDLGSRNGT